MKKTVSRLGSAALCVTLSLALGCGCAVMPPASSEKPASSAVSVPTDAEGKPLYDAARLDDGRLRILYGYDNSGDCRTVLCGSKVLYQSARSENVSLLAGYRDRRNELLVPHLVGLHRPGRPPQRPVRQGRQRSDGL